MAVLKSRRVIRQEILLALAVLTLSIGVWAAKATVDPPPYLGLELLGSGNIHALEPSGPAARAGLQREDRVIRVGGELLYGTYSLFHGRGTTESVEFEVRRGGKTFVATVIPDPPGRHELVFNLERLFVALMYWLVGVAVWLLRPSESAALLFFLVSQFTAGVMFAEILDPVIPAMSMVSDVFRYLVAPLVLHFFAIFPTPLAPSRRRALLSGAYGGYVLVTFLNLVSIAAGADVYDSGFWVVPRTFELVVFLIALGVLLRPQPTASLDARRRRRLLIVGIVVGLFPLMLTLVSMLRQHVPPLVPYEWSVPLLALIPVAYAYAVYKGELGRADFILNRGMVYLILTILLMGTYTFLYLSLDVFFGTERSLGSMILGASLIVAGSAAFVPLRARLQHGVDRLFYGGWYDYRSFVGSVSVDLSQSVDLDHIINQLRAAAETMRFHGGMLLWPNRDFFLPRGSFGVSRPMLSRLRLATDSPIIRYLEKLAAPCAHTDLAAALGSETLSEAEREVLDSREIMYWLPLVCRGTLRSILLAANRQGEEPLDHEDLAILETLSTQAAIACENIALLESLQERLAEVEKVRDELAEAQVRLAEGREDERLHMARELHDGPVQDLYAVLHGLDQAADESDGVDPGLLAPVRETLEGVAATLRDVCTELRPPLLNDFGLAVAIRSHVKRFSIKYPQLEIDLDLRQHADPLPERVQLALFRICQEALNNVAQHADASSIYVKLEVDAESIALEITDDGRGFVIPERWIEFGRRGMLGLLGMAERAVAIGGSLAARSAPGEGATLRVAAPLPGNETAAPSPILAEQTR